jgi:predicted XRE-type DNA-binding protein
MEERIIESTELYRGSGNVYTDLGLPDAEKLKIRTGLAIEIRKAMSNLGLTSKKPRYAWE